LRAVISGGYETKIIALGITDDIDQTELEGIASDPDSRNVILVADFNSLDAVEIQLRNLTCSGKQESFAVVQNCLSIALFQR